MLTNQTKQSLEKFIRTTNYLTVAQIFLRNNFLLERPLIPEDIKPRLLGHWGSCPGVNVIYAHLSHLIKRQNIANMLFLLGPGHAFPALQANLFLEQALETVDTSASLDEKGIAYISKHFSWPYAFPSHASPYSPGVILEGGELGYSLATAYGAVLDNPETIAACLIGDGEAETATLAASWHLNKIVAQPENGFVLPILHLNGYKISGPTLFGRMSDKELFDYFQGLRYEPHLVEYRSSQDDEVLANVLDRIYAKISAIKNGQAQDYRLPVLILRSAKGWGGIKQLSGKKVEGNHLSHQVVLDKAATDSYHLAKLETWLKSYKFSELFDGQKFGAFLDDVLPDFAQRMGANQVALGKSPKGQAIKILIKPDITQQAKVLDQVGELESLPLHTAGDYLEKLFALNQSVKNFRFFSPDETGSNRLQAIFKQTKRAWNLRNCDWDDHYARDGRAMEMLSEQVLEGLFHGYTLSGRYGVMTSYEAFMEVASSMMQQHAKFIEQAKEVSWRSPVPSLNFLLTSVGWRQDHNGFSHQNPTFVSDVLLRQGQVGQVLFPVDDNSMLVALDYCITSMNHINAIVAGKTEEPRWRTLEQAQADLRAGACQWDFASDDDPDLVLAAAGDYMAKEALLAIKLIKQELPEVKLRFVYVSALSSGVFGLGKKPLGQASFEQVFTKDKPIVFNFHGYPDTLKAILFNYLKVNRASVHGFMEKGSTTTPFDMMVRNQTSRYHLAIDVFSQLALSGKISSNRSDELTKKYQAKMLENTEYIKEQGEDLPEIRQQIWHS